MPRRSREPAAATACHSCMRTLAVVALLAAPAHADEGDADADLAARQPTAVYATLAGTTAKLTARFVLSLEGPRREDGQELAIPAGSIVTGGTAYAGGVAHRLQLEARDKLATRFDELSAAPASSDRRWGLRSIPSPNERHDRRRGAAFDSRRARCRARPPDVLRSRLAICGDSGRVATRARSQGAARRSHRAVPRRRAVDRVSQSRAGRAARRRPTDRWDRRPSATRRSPHRACRARSYLARSTKCRRISTPRSSSTRRARSMTTRSKLQRAIVESYLREAPNSHVQLIAYARRARAINCTWLFELRAGTTRRRSASTSLSSSATRR